MLKLLNSPIYPSLRRTRGTKPAASPAPSKSPCRSYTPERNSFLILDGYPGNLGGLAQSGRDRRASSVQVCAVYDGSGTSASPVANVRHVRLTSLTMSCRSILAERVQGEIQETRNQICSYVYDGRLAWCLRTVRETLAVSTCLVISNSSGANVWRPPGFVVGFSGGRSPTPVPQKQQIRSVVHTE